MKKKQDAQNSISKILDATVESISGLGYDGASMIRIAKKAGVSKSLLHYHFKSKEDLVIQALTSITQEIAADIRQQIDVAKPSWVRISSAVDALFDLFISSKERASFVNEMYSTAAHNERLNDQLKIYHKKQFEVIEEILSTAIGEDEQSFLFSLSDLAELVQTMILGLSVNRIFAENENRMNNYLQIFKKLLVLSITGKETN